MKTEFTERQILCHVLAHYKQMVMRYQDMFRDGDIPQSVVNQVLKHKAVVNYVEEKLKEMNRDLG